MNSSFRPKGRRAAPQKSGFSGVFLFVLVAGLAIYAFMGSPFFRVSKVSVEGLVKLTSEEIVLLSRIKPSDNIFRINPERVSERIRRSPRVKSAKVGRSLPSTIRVVVEERRGVAIMQYSDYFLEIDPSGIPISIVDDLGRSRLPVITGRRAVGVELGSPMRDSDLIEALGVPASLPDKVLWELSEINASNVNDVVLYTTDGIRIRWGATMQNGEKAKLLSSIIESLGSKDAKAGNIDISVPKMPVIAGMSKDAE